MRYVHASGVGTSWATASAPASGLFGFVQSFSFTSGQTVTPIYERGIPNHQKVTQKQPITLTVQYLWTGSAQTIASGSGATVPMHHLEYRASAAEMAGTPSGYYYQFHGAAIQSVQFNEAAEGNNIQVQYQCLGMNGPTGSGYLG
jgi:hypothetical protein